MSELASILSNISVLVHEPPDHQQLRLPAALILATPVGMVQGTERMESVYHFSSDRPDEVVTGESITNELHRMGNVEGVHISFIGHTQYLTKSGKFLYTGAHLPGFAGSWVITSAFTRDQLSGLMLDEQH
jgi:hypothetical protein